MPGKVCYGTTYTDDDGLSLSAELSLDELHEQLDLLDIIDKSVEDLDYYGGLPCDRMRALKDALEDATSNIKGQIKEYE